MRVLLFAKDGRLTHYVMQVILSAPAENESGTGSSTETPTTVSGGCEFSTCPAGAPAEGFNSSDSTFEIPAMSASR
jgi:5'-nucleotidase